MLLPDAGMNVSTFKCLVCKIYLIFLLAEIEYNVAFMYNAVIMGYVISFPKKMEELLVKKIDVKKVTLISNLSKL